jgi:adenylate cyclase
VLQGAFRRGEGECIDAVIWVCDLRGFTTLVDGAPIHEVLPTLDRYFECVADPIAARGGEVLKFIGDAVLAIFVDATRPQQALDAVTDSFAALDRLNAEQAASGRPSLSFGVALHVGAVTYGNIGGTGRLDFTVIGKAVNEVTRVESLCKTLGCRLLLTDAFARACGRADLRSLGRHPLRGVTEAPELFTLDL